MPSKGGLLPSRRATESCRPGGAREIQWFEPNIDNQAVDCDEFSPVLFLLAPQPVPPWPSHTPADAQIHSVSYSYSEGLVRSLTVTCFSLLTYLSLILAIQPELLGN